MTALRAVYVDLDNTLLGAGGSIVHDGEGRLTNLGFRAIEACHRADVEVVIMSGRRRSSAMEDARLLGCPSYIIEAGAAVIYPNDEDWLTEPYHPGEKTVFEQIGETGAPEFLLDRYRGALEYHDPWHTGRDVSHLFRGDVDAAAATALLEEMGFEALRLVDNGAIDPLERGWRAFHLLPKGVSKGRAVERHRQARGYPAEACIAIGDSREDLTAAAVVGTFWLVANALDRDPLLVGALPANARVCEAGNGPGVYEAVMTELAQRR